MIIQYTVEELCTCSLTAQQSPGHAKSGLQKWEEQQISRNVLQEGMTLHRRGVTEDLEALDSAQSRTLSDTPGSKGERSLLPHPMWSDIDYS